MSSIKYNDPIVLTLTKQDGEDVLMMIPDEPDRELIFIKMRPGNIIRLAQECSEWVFAKAHRDS